MECYSSECQRCCGLLDRIYPGSTVLNAIEREMKGKQNEAFGVICSIIAMSMIFAIMAESLQLQLLLPEKLEPTTLWDKSIPIA
jgi:nucleoside recognition membrane protein YjiH